MSSVSSTNPGLANLLQTLSNVNSPLLSTPNVSDWLGRIKFLLTGTLRYFDEGQYRFNHHISPLPDIQFRHLAAEMGLRIEESTTAGTFMGAVKNACLSPTWFPFRAVFGRSATGDVNLYLMTRSMASVPRAGDWTS